VRGLAAGEACPGAVAGVLEGGGGGDGVTWLQRRRVLVGVVVRGRGGGESGRTFSASRL